MRRGRQNSVTAAPRHEKDTCTSVSDPWTNVTEQTDDEQEVTTRTVTLITEDAENTHTDGQLVEEVKEELRTPLRKLDTQRANLVLPLPMPRQWPMRTTARPLLRLTPVPRRTLAHSARRG